MYRGKSTRGRMNDFDMDKYENTLPTKCNVRIDELEFNSPHQTRREDIGWFGSLC